jgi:hypothetical protein
LHEKMFLAKNLSQKCFSGVHGQSSDNKRTTYEPNCHRHRARRGRTLLRRSSRQGALISSRTQEAVAAAKAGGVRLGGTNARSLLKPGRATNALGANLEHGDIVLDREGDHSMPTLRNPRHERFAEELATGKTADAAYVLAGYKENRSNAARLGADRDIQARVAEIQSVGAERAAITVETLMAEAEEARSKAMGEKGGAAAAVAAITAKAKLAGLWREKVAQTDPSGENAPRYIISDHVMSEEDWIRERCGE